MRPLRTALLALTLPPLALAGAGQPPLPPAGQVAVAGHAAGTFLGFQDMPVGGLTWGPDGTAYTLDGTRLLYRWDARTGRPLSRRVLLPPAGLPDAGERFGPRLTLEGYRTEGAVRGPYLRVRGHRGAEPYQTAFTLTADGRAVLGSLGEGSAFSRDMRFLGQVEGKTAEGRARVQLFDRTGPGGQATVTLPAGQVVALEPAPDGGHVAALRLVRTKGPVWGALWWLDLWDVNTGRVTSRRVPDRFASEAPLAQVHWVDARRLLTATGDEDGSGGNAHHTLRLWNLTGPGPLWTAGQGEALQGAVPSPDGEFFLTVRADSLPEVHRIADGAFVRGLGAAVTAWTPLPGGRALLALETGGGAGELRTVGRDGTSARFGGERLGGVTRLAASPDGRWFALARGGQAGDDNLQHGSVSLLDAAGRTLHTWPVAPAVQRLGFAPDSRSLLARVAPDPSTPDWRGVVWAVGGRTLADRARTLPIGNVLVREDRRGQTGGTRTRLQALSASGEVLWQEGWRAEWNPEWLPSPDGRALVRALGQPIPGAVEQQAQRLVRVDSRTGAVSPGVTLTPREREVYRGLALLDFAPDRRHVLLGEGSGDGCGASFYGLRLADLGARREVALPLSLTRGLERDSGCGLPVPFPQAAFAPDGGHLLVREGNAVRWWAGGFGTAP